MELSEEKLRKYYREVAESLIEDGVNGWPVEALTQHLMDDPDNPFRPLSKEELFARLEAGMQDIEEENCLPFEDAMEEIRKMRRHAHDLGKEKRS